MESVELKEPSFQEASASEPRTEEPSVEVAGAREPRTEEPSVEVAGASESPLLAATPGGDKPPLPSATARIVAKNTLWLVGGQLLGMPLSILLNAVLARRLGAEEFGLLFLITTMSGFAATFSEFGQTGAAQRAIARDRDEAGEFVSAAIVVRLACFVVAHGTLAGAVYVLAYQPAVALGLVLVGCQTLLGQLGGTAVLAARAFERSDLVARNMVILQVITVMSVLPVLLAGGGLLSVLGAQLFAGAVAAWIDWRLLRRLGIALRRFHVDIARPLAREGASFLVLGAVMALQWNINAVMLSKLAEAPDVGWYAASQRLVGFLIFPCSAVIASLYPTLCRLLKESPQEALETTRSALSIVSWIALPVATCCALFPDIGIQIFSRESFGPAEDNLRISAMTVFCLYLAMVLATYLNALGLQRAWTKLQLASVVISSALNWLLIPVFQRTHGNGGLGVVCATLAAEAFLVTGGLWVAPARIVNRSLLRSFGWALLSAVVMGVVGSLLRPLTSSWMAAPICVVVYVGCLRVTGVLNPGTLQILQSMLRRQQPAT